MKTVIRTAIPAGALMALAFGIFLPASHDLPAVALDNRELLWTERSLVFFYGFLLLFVPFFRALHGELPIELSTRGARYAETSEVIIEELQVRLAEVEGHLDEVVEIVDVLGEPITG